MAAAGLLYDMAALQPTERSQFGYKRAAKTIAALPVSVREIVAAGALREIPYIGPSSARIITELVEQGASPTVETAMAAPKVAKARAARGFREAFLSAHVLEAVLSADAPATLAGVEGYRGDFQMHSTWSDGGESISTMAAACLDLGHACLGITDHSHGLPIARGVSMADIARQHVEIDRLNERYEGRFRVFKGIEANILGDGDLDLTREERGVFEFVVASPHSLLRRADDQTARMLGAVQGAGVAMLGHPRGRMFNTRPGVTADWARVFAEAARRRVAIELDGNWHRQDIDYALARRALDAGCLFALDSDAHSIPELRFSRYAVAHARLAGIPKARIINYWSDADLEQWMGERK